MEDKGMRIETQIMDHTLQANELTTALVTQIFPKLQLHTVRRIYVIRVICAHTCVARASASSTAGFLSTASDFRLPARLNPGMWVCISISSPLPPGTG